MRKVRRSVGGAEWASMGGGGASNEDELGT